MASITCMSGRSVLSTSSKCAAVTACGEASGGVGGHVARSGGVVGVPEMTWEWSNYSLAHSVSDLKIGSSGFLFSFSSGVALSGPVALSVASWRVGGGGEELCG